MPGLIKDLVTLFLEVFLLEQQNLKNDFNKVNALKECASYWPSLGTIEFYLAEMEWEDFEDLSNSLIQFYLDDDRLIVIDVQVMELDQSIKVILSPDAYHILMS